MSQLDDNDNPNQSCNLTYIDSHLTFPKPDSMHLTNDNIPVAYIYLIWTQL